MYPLQSSFIFIIKYEICVGTAVPSQTMRIGKVSWDLENQEIPAQYPVDDVDLDNHKLVFTVNFDETERWLWPQIKPGYSWSPGSVWLSFEWPKVEGRHFRYWYRGHFPKVNSAISKKYDLLLYDRRYV